MILDAVKSNCLLVWGALSEQGLRQIKEEGQVVMVPENRPHMTGLRHNAPLLKTQGVRFIYCTDNMLGLLFYKNNKQGVICISAHFGSFMLLTLRLSLIGYPCNMVVKDSDNPAVAGFWQNIRREAGNREEDIYQVTQAYTKTIEDFIRRYPEQWWWPHKRWKKDL